MTLNTYKEDRKKAMEMNKVIRQNQQKEIYSTSFYLDSLNEVRSKLERSTMFLQEASEEPILFFTKSKEHWGSHRNILYRCLDYKGRETKQGTIHEFQAFLGTKLDEVFQTWKQEQGIEEDLKIEIRNANSFPSNYAVYLDNQEMMQFNIFEQTYGVRGKAEPEEKILQAGQKEEIRLKEEEKKEQEILEKLLEFQESPYSNIVSLRDFFHVVFKKRETMEKTEHAIESRRERLLSIQERIQRNRDQLPYILKDNQKLHDTFSLIEPFFQKLNYTLEEDQSKLY